eukprot:8724343-Pyramimonas_sp.AAC.1
MYAQAAPDGPVANIFKETFMRWKWGRQNRPIMNKKGADVSKCVAHHPPSSPGTIHSLPLECLQ